MVGQLADMLDIRLLSLLVSCWYSDWQPCLLAGFMASLQVDWLKFRLISWLDGLLTSQTDCWLMVYLLYSWFSSLPAFWPIGCIAVLLANWWDISLTGWLSRHMNNRLAGLFFGFIAWYHWLAGLIAVLGTSWLLKLFADWLAFWRVSCMLTVWKIG